MSRAFSRQSLTECVISSNVEVNKSYVTRMCTSTKARNTIAIAACLRVHAARVSYRYYYALCLAINLNDKRRRKFPANGERNASHATARARVKLARYVRALRNVTIFSFHSLFPRTPFQKRTESHIRDVFVL